MKILGIDPGTAATGWGVIDGEGDTWKKKDAGVFLTDSKSPPAERLKLIYEEMERAIQTHRPDAVVVEKLFFARDARTVLAVGQARGVALLAAVQEGLEIFEYSVLQIKQAVTGYGKADKESVRKMVAQQLGMNSSPPSFHEADALAAAICHAHSHRFAEKVESAG